MWCAQEFSEFLKSAASQVYFPVVDGFDDPKSHAELVRFTPLVHFSLAETPVGEDLSVFLERSGTGMLVDD